MEWVPDGALVVLDFKNDKYWFAGDEHTRSESIEENTDWSNLDPATFAAGVGARANNERGVCAFVLTTGAAAEILPSAGGFTAVITYTNEVIGASGNANSTIEALDLPNYNVEWMATFGSWHSHEANSISSISGAAPSGDAGTSHVAAFTLAPGDISASVDGNAIESVASIADNSTATHIAVSVSVYVPDAIATAILEKIVFYTPQDSAVLPGLSG
jgi:hypothetical protein